MLPKRAGEREPGSDVAAHLVHAQVAEAELHECGEGTGTSALRRPDDLIRDDIRAGAAMPLHRRTARQRVDQIGKARGVIPSAERNLARVRARELATDLEAPAARRGRRIESR